MKKYILCIMLNKTICSEEILSISNTDNSSIVVNKIDNIKQNDVLFRQKDDNLNFLLSLIIFYIKKALELNSLSELNILKSFLDVLKNLKLEQGLDINTLEQVLDTNKIEPGLETNTLEKDIFATLKKDLNNYEQLLETKFSPQFTACNAVTPKTAEMHNKAYENFTDENIPQIQAYFQKIELLSNIFFNKFNYDKKKTSVYYHIKNILKGNHYGESWNNRLFFNSKELLFNIKKLNLFLKNITELKPEDEKKLFFLLENMIRFDDHIYSKTKIF